jgi:hypothetical protein
MNTSGVVTLPVLEHDVSVQFLETEQAFPEFQPGTRPYVLGGFAAYANPSSFHSPFVKELRKATFEKVVASQVFQTYLQEVRPDSYEKFHLEVLFDRVLHRFPGQKPNPETAHRDVTPHKLLREEDDDLLFGGWLNLTAHEQFFVGKPGSHLGVRNTYEVSKAHKGFCTLDTKSDEYAEYQATKRKFSVPPGHLVIFPQHLVHEVLSQKSPHEQFRLFFGWRLTRGTSTLFPDKERAIDTLGVPTIPSGQIPALFSCHHQSVFKHKEFNWTGPGGPKGTLLDWASQTLKVPLARHLESLKHYGLDYPGYTPEEKKFLLELHPLF